jgi:hypothetical protein
MKVTCNYSVIEDKQQNLYNAKEWSYVVAASVFYYIYYNNNAIPTQEKSALQFEKHALCSLCILEEAQWSGGFLWAAFAHPINDASLEFHSLVMIFLVS